MIRFKVVKGSHLLLIVSILILLAVILFLALQSSFGTGSSTSNVSSTTTVLEEAKAVSAFASSNNSLSSLNIQILPDAPPNETASPSKGNILIYHTHTHEAYEQDNEENYIALEAWRTDDNSHNVVQLGNALADELRKLGYSVIHDTTDHELDSLENAYVRSLETLQSYECRFDLCIDLHRDAYVEGLLPCLESSDGIEYAQMMCLVGRGDNYPEHEKPNYQLNLQFAQKLTNALNSEIPNLCRNVTIKTGRYNQHIGNISLLIEVGHNKNTLQQALYSIPILAFGIDKVL